MSPGWRKQLALPMSCSYAPKHTWSGAEDLQSGVHLRDRDQNRQDKGKSSALCSLEEEDMEEMVL